MTFWPFRTKKPEPLPPLDFPECPPWTQARQIYYQEKCERLGEVIKLYRGHFYKSLRDHGLWEQGFEPGWDTESAVERLCKALKESRAANKRLRSKIKIVRATSTEERREAIDEALREVRAERLLLDPSEHDLVAVLHRKLKALRLEMRRREENDYCWTHRTYGKNKRKDGDFRSDFVREFTKDF